MTRQRKQVYRTRELSELARQLLYSPPEKRVEAVRHAEQFHDEIEPGKNYPIDFVVYRLTDRRVPPSESVMLAGEAVAPDLRLLIDTLSRSMTLPSDEGDPAQTVAELAKDMGVSTKTIGRWRDVGLRWRWGVRGAGRKPNVLITRSALQAFEAQHPGRLGAAARFTRLDQAEKQSLLARVRRLASVVDRPPQSILTHVARRTGRSVESLRLLVTQHDAEHPAEAVFADRAGPLTDKQKRVIDRAYQRGITVTAICQRFRKTRSTIYRAIHEARARRACRTDISVVHSPTFDREDADEVLMQPILREGKRRWLDRKVIAGLPEQLRPLYGQPRDQDAVVRSLIVRYNYIKYRAAAVQKQLAAESLRAMDLDRFDELLARANAVRGEILSGVLPVVLSVVRRQLAGEAQASADALIQMLGVGNRVLLEEIDRFDASVAHSFESVLTNRLLRVLVQPPDECDWIDADRLVGQLWEAGLREHQADND